ncbi:indole-3-glycerol-phosphate synthase [Candidatus Parvarchaeota archaeon]|nr:indole-3-glycerol-phosphate synthase [Candidatus Parvarchaeota archaeon]
MDILDRFIETAKENIARGYYSKFIDKCVKSSQINDSVRHCQPLSQALSKNRFSIICEIKHASPAGEYSFDYIDVAKTAAGFKSAGADAISVVVEPQIFKGDLGNVSIASAASGLPTLFKDFVLERIQIDAAKASGASCVLLVVKVAKRAGFDLDQYISHAHGLGLEVLLECYDKKEMDIALETKADILGINNRDLQTLEVDLNRTKNILAAYGGSGRLGRKLISESGIKNRADAQFVKKCGASGVLVGTALWKAKDQKAKIMELKGA